MRCKTCNAPMQWDGSFSRGGMVCRGCAPAKINKILKRYELDVHVWHRIWCDAMRNRPKSSPVLASQCDCGHMKPSPYSEAEIEQRERAAYGDAP